jgi:hypothetical protein
VQPFTIHRQAADLATHRRGHFEDGLIGHEFVLVVFAAAGASATLSEFMSVWFVWWLHRTVLSLKRFR